MGVKWRISTELQFTVHTIGLRWIALPVEKGQEPPHRRRSSTPLRRRRLFRRLSTNIRCRHALGIFDPDQRPNTVERGKCSYKEIWDKIKFKAEDI